jgi:hypothetical protein
MYLTNPLFFYFDKLITELVAYGFIYKQISINSIKFVDIYDPLNEFVLSIIPKLHNTNIINYYEIIVPLYNSRFTYKTKFTLYDHSKAVNFLNSHIELFKKHEVRSSLLDNDSLDY